MQTFCIIALGCDKNIIDAEGTVKALTDAGYLPVESVGDADIVVVHTCAFIDEAKEESIRVILESARDKGRGAQLVVSGCLAQRYAEKLARQIPEVDLFLGVGRHAEVLGSLGKERVSVGSPDGWLPVAKDRVPSTPPYTAFVKVSEGCDNRCSYCVIPEIRGSLRSRPVPEIVDEVKWLSGMGLVELNLVAQDLASYGAEGGGGGLVELLTAILGETDVPWVRLLYLHPGNITDRLIDLMASERRILGYADIPIQHISDGILASMGRKIDKEGIVSLLASMRRKIDGLFFRTSLIVGYPGEGEREFSELMDFVQETRFHHLGVFVYSREAGTRAAGLSRRVVRRTAERRRDRIMSLQQGISLAHNRGLVGSVQEVLVEGACDDDPGRARGRFYGQAPEVDGNVIVDSPDVRPGQVVPVTITDALPYDLIGTVLR